MSTFANIAKILKQSLNTQKSDPAQLRNKLAFNIFHVVSNFADILTTVKIVKKLMQAKKNSIFKRLEVAISKFDKVGGPR